MSFTYITVTGHYLDEHGMPAAGKITFLPSSTLQDGGSNVITSPLPVIVVLDSAGEFSTVLVATNDPGIQPTGVTYLVIEKIGHGRKYSIELPYDAVGATVDMADVAPVTDTLVVYGVTLNTAQTISAVKSHSADITFTTGAKGVVLVDRTTGFRYRLYINNGILALEVAP